MNRQPHVNNYLWRSCHFSLGDSNLYSCQHLPSLRSLEDTLSLLDTIPLIAESLEVTDNESIAIHHQF